MQYTVSNHNAIKNLFYNQVKKMTKRTCANESFDIQFSDDWII